MIEPILRENMAINGATIFVQKFGCAKPDSKEISPESFPLFFIHGNGENWHCFDKQIEFFCAFSDVYTMDSRGHGQSSEGPGNLSLKQIAEDAVEIMNELNIAQALVVGFSDGANIALHMAIRHPEKIASLILAGGNIYPSGVKIRYQLPSIIEFFVLKCLSLFSPRAGKKSRIVGLMVLEPHISVEELRKLVMPTLVLAGDNDMILDRHTRLIASSIPGAELAIIDGSDHFVFKMRPEQVNERILQFLQKPKNRVEDAHL